MNLLYETNQRITYSNARLRDLHECLKKDTLTKDAESYLKDEIKKSKKNIEYYSELLQELEKGGEA
ncbi:MULTISPECIES: hypothetical protein [Clostridium]|uniref:hypothetical protein n=1 Tax=Clostridium TaxID=1485 RepID=UPI002900C00C|nr:MULTISPECIES: hypothetical protein [Clostridium]MDU1229905.1 hypothetical protein [Clostridium sp.]